MGCELCVGSESSGSGSRGSAVMYRRLEREVNWSEEVW